MIEGELNKDSIRVSIDGTDTLQVAHLVASLISGQSRYHFDGTFRSLLNEKGKREEMHSTDAHRCLGNDRLHHPSFSISSEEGSNKYNLEFSDSTDPVIRFVVKNELQEAFPSGSD